VSYNWIMSVDVDSESFKIARRYMIRLRKDDFDDAHALATFAATAGVRIDQFRQDFEHVVDDEPSPIHLHVPSQKP